jgi:hypothetical protein
MALKAFAAVASRLIGGTEFLDVVPARTAQTATMAPALFRALGVVGTPHDPSGMRLAGYHRKAKQAGEKNCRFSHGLARTCGEQLSVAALGITHHPAIGCIGMTVRLRPRESPIN